MKFIIISPQYYNKEYQLSKITIFYVDILNILIHQQNVP